jgi:hypothetical protein
VCRPGKLVLGAAVVLGASACVFLAVVAVGQGLVTASLWAGVLAAVTGIMAAIAAVWSLLARPPGTVPPVPAADQLLAVDRAVAFLVERPVAAASRYPLGDLLDELPGPFSLGVHRAVGTGAETLPDLPEYAPRAHDLQLREFVRGKVADHASLMIVLVGDSSTGKTRALWEAVHDLPTGWRVWSPPSPSALNDGLLGRGVGPRTVVWLNDAHNYLDSALTQLAGDNAARLSALLSDPGIRPVLVLATLWPWNWQQLTSQSGAVAVSGGSASDQGALIQVAQLLETARCILVPVSFQEDDLAAVRAAGRLDPRMALAHKHARGGRLTQYLAGSQKILERYDTAPEEVKAVINAAVDARRMGHAQRLPESLLFKAALGYIDEPTSDRLDDTWAAQALFAATEDWRGLDGPLARLKPLPADQPGQGRVYKLSDALEQTGIRIRRYTAPPGEFWTAAGQHAHPDDVAALARAAQVRGRYKIAAILYIKAANAGRTACLTELARIRRKMGDRAGAAHLEEQAMLRFEHSAELTDTTALMELADSRMDGRDLAAAGRLYQWAADAGATQALWGLAKIRELSGDSEGAEQLAFTAAASGHTWTLERLAQMRAPGVHLDTYTTSEEYDEMRQNALDETTAETRRLYRLARDAGYSWAESERNFTPEARTTVHETEGVRIQAADRRADRSAASADVGWVLRDLARAQEHAGNHSTAEHLAISAAGTGSAWVLIDLARIRESAGDHDGAAKLAAMAAAHGSPAGLVDLALASEKADDYVRAVQLCEQAAIAGHKTALRHLSRIQEKAGDHTGAEQRALQAADAGMIAALQDLAIMREKAGNLAGAARLFLMSANAGEPAALEGLARIREHAGDMAGAERLRRFGLDTEGNIASQWAIAEISP